MNNDLFHFIYDYLYIIIELWWYYKKWNVYIATLKTKQNL